MNCNNKSLRDLNDQIISCQRCPRLRQHCKTIAEEKRRAYLDWKYWGRPVPSFGDPEAELLILGLAPGAHGANRTGRIFTGDRSGDFLFRAMHKAGLASQPQSKRADDGLTLRNTWISCAVHCAPPDNKPTGSELANCLAFLSTELELLKNVRVVLVLGKIAFDAYFAEMRTRTGAKKQSGCAFGHNARIALNPVVLCSYHPSQQNTSTGRLTEAMMDDVFDSAKQLLKA